MKLVIALLALAFGAFAADSSTPAKLDALLKRYNELGIFNGSTLVAEQGQVIAKKGYGMANFEWSIPNAPDTKFRLGSITKQFTAALIQQLAEQGKIEMNAPVSRYLPEYPARTGDKVTIHQLLNHTNGIVGYTELPAFGKISRDPYTPTKFLEVFSKLDLMFEPGTKFSYSNSGYFLAGVVAEKVSGKSYEKLLQERIFDPAGMKDSGYDSTRPLLTKRAAGYDNTFDGFVNTSFIEMSQPYAAGSLYSTVEDLYRWDQALYGDKILSAASKEKAFQPGLSNYGYGWVITKKDGVTTIEHGGGINGFNTIITRNPETKRLIVLLSNAGGAPLNEMADEIRAILDGKEAKMPKTPAAPVLFKTYKASGYTAMLNQATEMKRGSQYDVSEGQLARVAGQMLGNGKPADALALAKILAEASPKSVGAVSLLAQAHRANGNRVEAIQSYSKAIEMSDTPRALIVYTDAIKQLATLDAPKP